MLNITFCELRRVLLKALAAYNESLFYYNELSSYRENHERATKKSKRLEELWHHYHNIASAYCDALAVMTYKTKGYFFDILTKATNEADLYDPDWMRNFCESASTTIFER